MTENLPPSPPEDSAASPSGSAPRSAAGPAYLAYPAPSIPPERIPFSKLAIWGFVISCVSLLVLGFIGVIGAGFSSYAIRAVRRGTVRGRGLAIAGMIIGGVGFLFYAINRLVHMP